MFTMMRAALRMRSSSTSAAAFPLICEASFPAGRPCRFTRPSGVRQGGVSGARAHVEAQSGSRWTATVIEITLK
jgi:hypothetical protein